MSPGFAEPVLDAQAAFRATLEAMSRPGRIEELTMRMDPPAGLDPATVAACLTLLDIDTPVWLAPHAAADRAAAWIAFHTGAPLVASAGDAAFVVVLDAGSLSALDDFDWGTDEEPQRGATLIVQVPVLASEGGWRLSGPGIATRAALHVGGLPEAFAAQRRAMNGAFPRGVDILFTSGARLAALPRTTILEA
ncbi:MAG: phosphonate C-P lyase system protein PhnH [Alphaproteobacteria bacterium]|nr:phosphonate C-P lyase system protein PhnH [Alphaproteobacteria bacterium]MCW5738716.1 phosphonate C-P lyase system protein PhnH [Alphaproteobacteria bacterium]